MARLQQFCGLANTIHALAVRETQLLFDGKKRLGWINIYLHPLLFITGITMLRPFLFGRFSVDRLEPVLPITGILMFFMFRDLLVRSIRMGKPVNGLYNFSRVTPVRYITSLALVYWNKYMPLMTGLLLVCHELGVKIQLNNWLYAVLGPVILIAFGLGAGLFFWSFLQAYPYFTFMFTYLPMLLFWVSGLLYSATSLPVRIQWYLSWNPIFVCIEMARFGLGSDTSNFFIAPLYVALCAFISLAFGLLLANRASRIYRQ